MASEKSPEEALEVPEDALGSMRRLWVEAGHERWRLVVAVIASVAYVTLSILAPAYSAGLIDYLWGRITVAFAEGRTFSVSMTEGGTMVLTYLGIWTGAWAFYSVQVMVMASFSERLNLALRRRISAKLGTLPLGYFDARKSGDTISRATNDLDKISEVLQRGVTQVIISATTLVGAVAMMTRYNVGLTVVFLAFAAVGGLVTKFIAGRTLRSAARRQRVVGELTSSIEEAYSGRAIVKAFGLEGATLESVRRGSDELASTSATADFLTYASGCVIRFIGRLGQVTLGVLAGGMLLGGGLSVGQFQAFFQYCIQANEPLTQLAQTTSMLQGALAAAERVFRLLDADDEVADPSLDEALAPAEPVRGRIEFSHVAFGYEPGKPLMRDVSLVANPGEKVAIVGATGAGKTTLINLLMRFYEIDGGSITLDGVPTNRMTRSDLRRQFGMVLQDAWLFGGTVAENIAYGRPDATREEIEAAARAAHVDFFVRTLPHGYDTVLSNDAESVSQGQRQLLTIARAMLCDPAILILDEATSCVDTRTEQAIVRAMEAIMENRTSFVIAHRLNTIVDADLILVMDHGDIIEQGTHEELLAMGGAYAELYRSQFS